MPTIWYLFTIRRVFAILLTLVLLTSFIGLYMKKYRKFMPKILILLSVLSSILLLSNYLIYWKLLLIEKDTSNEGFVRWDPFPQFLSTTLNWQVPCILAVVIASIIMKKKIKLNICCWIGIATAIASICGFIVLAYLVFVRLFEDLGKAAWWLF